MHAQVHLATVSLSDHPAGKRGGGGSGGSGGVRVRRGEHVSRHRDLASEMGRVMGRVWLRVALGLGCGRPLWRQMMMMGRIRSSVLIVLLGGRLGGFVCGRVCSAAADDYVVRRHGRHPRLAERKLIAMVLAVVLLAWRRIERLRGGNWAAVDHRHYGAAHYGATLILGRRGASMAVLAQHAAMHLQTRRLHLLAQWGLARWDAKRARQPRDACA